jgi:hypothetical protein
VVRGMKTRVPRCRLSKGSPYMPRKVRHTLLVTSVLIPLVASAFVTSVSGAAVESNSGTSESGKNFTLRVPVQLCGNFHVGGDQIIAGIVCNEPVERSYRGKYEIVKKNRCKKTGVSDGRPLELLRTANGVTEVLLTHRPGDFQGYATVFDPREKYGPSYQGRFPDGSYAIRVRGFSYRGKVWDEVENVYYHDAKIVCEPEEFKIGTLPLG